MVIIYNALLFLAVLIALPVILPAVLCSEKRRKTVLPRLGVAPSQPLPRGKTGTLKSEKPIWVHALSVGEVLSATPLLSGLTQQYPGRPVLLTVSTLTGYRIARERLHSITSAIRFFPYDLPFSIKRALHLVDPAMVLMVETDIWPNFMNELKKRNIPAFLVNARLSARAYRNYKRFSFFFGPVFSAFTYICTQSEMDAERFSGLGIARHRIVMAGNLKFDQNRPVLTPEQLIARRQSLAINPAQPVIVAGSTHEGEEEILLGAFCRLKTQWPSLVMMVAPRDPKRAASVTQLAKSAHLKAFTMTALEDNPSNQSVDVIIVDRLGLLRDFYALADVAFVGGSLVACSGHNPLEPAAWAKPILFGPDMRDFMSISTALESAGGAVTVQNAEAFYRNVNALLSNPEKAHAMGKISLSIFQSNGGAVKKMLSLTAPFLPHDDQQE
ncbi:MAG: 3-deoxy-D-manno-octulosonic acid transferase [Desulfobacterales bacterium]|jgi:3-deoxy-D-manno-octulosonic-acid transferase|nr:3-deoxy-D-manno-octulosonic acid transferase [Desulfobacterales bacterium]